MVDGRDAARHGRSRAALLGPTLRGYRKQWISADVVAGLTLVAVAVPEQLAIARLVGLPPVTGLYAFVAGSVVFVLLGANPFISVGADSSTAPVIAAAAASIAVAGSHRYVEVVGLLALLVGVIVAAAGLLRLGWIADFLSAPVVAGVLAGIAVEIAVRQLAPALGTPGGGTTTIGRVERVFDERHQVHWWAVGVTVAVLAAVSIAERINRRVPGALIAVVASSAAVAGFQLKAHGVLVVGALRSGLPAFGLPTGHLSDTGRLIGAALTISFLCIVQTSATARAGTADPHPSSELNRDLIAVGAGGLLAGLSGTFTVNASPPRSALTQTAGGRSQAASLVAVAAVVGLLFAGGLLSDLPEACLAGILLFIASRLVHVKELVRIFRFDRFEFALAILAFGVVAVVGIEQGVVAASLLALAERTRLAARPRGVFLGREPGTDHWVPTDIGRPTESVAGVLVYLPYAPLWYGNSAYVVSRLLSAIDSQSSPVTALILDMDGVSDVDFTGATKLEELAEELQHRGIGLGIARSSHLVHHDLKRSGVLAQIGTQNLYPSVQDAVLSLHGTGTGPPPAPAVD